jgi:hypothetical protein
MDNLLTVVMVPAQHWPFHVGGVIVVAALALFLGPWLARSARKTWAWAMLVAISAMVVGVIAMFATFTVFKAVHPFAWWLERGPKPLEGHVVIRIPILPELGYFFGVYMVGLSVGAFSAVVWILGLVIARRRHTRAAPEHLRHLVA